MDYQKKALEVLGQVTIILALSNSENVEGATITITAALEQAYKEGVEAGRQEILAIKRRELTAEEQAHGEQVAARLLSLAKGEPK